MKNRILVISTALFFVLVLSSCNKDSLAENKKNGSISVETNKIKRIKISNPITSSGRIYSSEEAKLSFKTGGILSKLNFKEGQFVNKGKLLAQLDLIEINAKVAQAKDALDKSKRDFERINKLYTDKVATLEQKQNLQTALNISEKNYEIAKFNLKHSSIIAPTDGKILKKFVEINEMVNTGYPIILFGKSGNNWKLKVGLSDVNLVKIKLGDRTEVNFDAFPGKIFTGRISEIGQAANPLNGTFEIEISIDDKENLLVSGFMARVKIFPSTSKKVTVVPIESLIEADELEASIFIPSTDKNSVIKKRVKISHLLDSEVVLFNDLNEFNEVVTAGAEYLKNGSKIRIVKKN